MTSLPPFGVHCTAIGNKVKVTILDYQWCFNPKAVAAVESTYSDSNRSFWSKSSNAMKCKWSLQWRLFILSELMLLPFFLQFAAPDSVLVHVTLSKIEHDHMIEDVQHVLLSKCAYFFRWKPGCNVEPRWDSLPPLPPAFHLPTTHVLNPYLGILREILGISREIIGVPWKILGIPRREISLHPNSGISPLAHLLVTDNISLHDSSRSKIPRSYGPRSLY